jgi:hypothetical protein
MGNILMRSPSSTGIIDRPTSSLEIIEPKIEHKLLGVWLDALDLDALQIACRGHTTSHLEQIADTRRAT